MKNSIPNQEFKRTLFNSKSLLVRDLLFYYQKNKAGISFIVNRKKGNAVLRNLFKRRCRALYQQNNSLKKLSEKNCDWIIANDISKNDIGFESDFNKVSIFYKNNSEENLPKMRKSSLANEIVNRIISQLN